MRSNNAGPAARRMLVCAVALVATLGVGGCQYLNFNQPTEEQLKAANPDLELIESHLSDFIEANPNLGAGFPPKTCGELKIAMVQRAKGTLVDMTAANAIAKVGDTVYFSGRASHANERLVIDGANYLRGAIDMGGTVHQLGLPDNRDLSLPMNARMKRGEFARGGKDSALFADAGVDVCGYGALKRGPGNAQIVSVIDVLEVASPASTASIGDLRGESVTGLQAPGANAEPAPAPTGCELLEEQHQSLDAACKGGRLQACREISGVVAAKMMEGCGSDESNATAGLPEEAAAPAPVATRDPQEETCAIIDRKEAEMRASCENGRIASCQEITQMVGVRIMEGCKTREQKIAASAPPPVEVPKPKLADRDATLANVKNNPPKYPPAEARAGVGGTVKLLITIAPGGFIADVGVGTSSGNRNLDRAAVDAARRWSAQAAIRDGEEITQQIRVPVDFHPPTGEDPLSAPAPIQSGY